VSLGSTLKDALSSMLLHDSGSVAVTEDGAVRGVLTPGSLYAALRRSVDGASG
jgi:osmoprotectant transport system ATP-binding protein